MTIKKRILVEISVGRFSLDEYYTNSDTVQKCTCFQL